MNAVIVKLRGGLGNQLFQYAYALKVQKCFYPDKKIVLDTSYFNSNHIRNLDLNKLNIENCEWNADKKCIFDITYDLYRGIARLFGNRFNFSFSGKILDDGYIYCNRTFNLKLKRKKCKAVYLAGYFQQEQDLREIRADLEKTIIPKQPLSSEAEKYQRYLNYSHMKNMRNIAISIRIGDDYIKYGWPICSHEFYEKGIEKLDGVTNQIFVFADEIDKVINEAWFSAYRNVIYVRNMNNVESLYIMRQCDDFIISNSTFAWWGAYLGERIDKHIIAPKFFYKGVEMQKSGLCIPSAYYLDNSDGEE